MKFVQAVAMLTAVASWGCASAAGPVTQKPRTEVSVQPVQRSQPAAPLSASDSLGSLSVINTPQIADG
jgi:hypothetical protein